MTPVVPSIPTVDIAPLVAGPDSAEAAAAASAIDAACREVGFFTVTGHTVAPEVAGRLFASAVAFFDADEHDKRALAIGNSDNHTGWVDLEAEQLQPDLRPDRKEALDIALEPRALGRDGALVSQLPDTPGLVDSVIAFQRDALVSAHAVLRGICLALDLPVTFFADAMTDPQCFLRLLHYPPVGGDRADDQLGCGAHTDYGLITVLQTDGVAGLQVQRRDGEWIDVAAPSSELVINLGDMLARWTDDAYVSTPHRVSSPERDHRYSIPFFVNPDPSTVVEAIPACVPAGAPPRYEPVTAGAYLQSRFDDTHAYRT